jgi:predicted dehydrogenase
LKLKGAVIGLGFIAAEGHIPAYAGRDDVEIVSVADGNPDRQVICENLLPGARFYPSAQTLLQEEDLDFVDICSPPGSHKDLILAALDQGLHVLCEKPLVLKPEHLQEISGKRQSLSVFTVHNWKFAPIFLKTSQLLEQKAIGNISNIRYEVYRTKPSVTVASGDQDINWRLDAKISGGGILVDHGWHAFYNICSWMGESPKNVTCLLENRKFKNHPVEDTASVEISFGNTQASLFFTWSAQERKNTVLIEGSEGKLKILDGLILLENGAGVQEFPFDEALSQGSHHPEWYPFVLRDFIASMTKPAAQQANFQEACQSLLIMESAQRSSANEGQLMECR